MKYLFYVNRALAFFVILAWTVYVTSRIGQTTSSDPLDWIGAWRVVLFFISVMLVGFMAGRESAQKKP